MACIYNFLESCAEEVAFGLSYGSSRGIIAAFSTEIDLTRIFSNMAKELDLAMKVGIEQAHFRENVGLLGRDIGNGLVEVISDFYKQVAIKATPWIVLSGGAIVGTPYLVSYVYYRVKHNIGRPKLATKIKYVDFYHRVTDRAVRTAGVFWNAACEGINRASITVGIGYPATLLSAMVALYLNKKPLIDPEWAIDNIGTVSGAVAGIAAFSSLAKQTFNYVRGWSVSEDEPMFNEKLTEKIDEIVAGTKHIKKDGVFLSNLLFHGPAGTGKTMVSEVIAEKAGFNYIKMTGGDLAQFIKRGEHVTEMNRLMESANNTSSPTIIFIDEAEALCRKREELDKSELLELLDAFLEHTGKPSKQMMIILATNRMEDLDPAVLSRMDHKLLIGPPEFAERKRILAQYTQKFFGAKDFFSEAKLDWISGETEGLTGRSLFKMVNALAVKKAISSDQQLTEAMIDMVVADFIEQEIQVGVLANRKIKPIKNPLTLPIELLFQRLRDFLEAFFKPFRVKTNF